MEEENLDPTGSLATFVSPRQSGSDVFQENLRLIVQDLTGKNVTLDEYTELILMKAKAFPDAEIVEQGNTHLANRPARQLIYTVNEGI